MHINQDKRTYGGGGGGKFIAHFSNHIFYISDPLHMVLTLLIIFIHIIPLYSILKQVLLIKI